MVRMSGIIGLFLALFMTVGTIHAEEAVVTNGGFEEGLKGWSVSGVILPDEEFFYSGKAGARLEGNPKGQVLLTQILPKLKPNTKYHLKFLVKTKDVVPNKQGTYYSCGVVGAIVNVYCGKNKNLFFPNKAFTGSMPWTVQGFDFTSGEMGEGIAPSYIRLFLWESAGTAWFDDFVIEEVGTNG